MNDGNAISLPKPTKNNLSDSNSYEFEKEITALIDRKTSFSGNIQKTHGFFQVKMRIAGRIRTFGVFKEEKDAVNKVKEIRSKIAFLKANPEAPPLLHVQSEENFWYEVFFLDDFGISSGIFFTNKQEIIVFDDKNEVLRSEKMNPQPVFTPKETNLLQQEVKERKVKQLEMF